PLSPMLSRFPYTTFFRSFFVSIEWSNCDNRTEDFFLEDAGVGGNVSKHCWLQEVSFWEFFGTLATGNQAGFFFSDLDIGPDFVRSEEHTSELQSRFDLVC